MTTRIRARAIMKSLGGSQEYICEDANCTCRGKGVATFDVVADVQSKDGSIKEHDRLFLCDSAVLAAFKDVVARTTDTRDKLAGVS